LVVGNGGQIWVYGPDRQQGQTFLDITQRVRSGGFEQGLLGLAFPPGYGPGGFFFVNYTDQNGHTVVSRFQVSDDPNRADAASEFVILRMEQPASNHNGGMLAFGPDGYLYIGTGDGGRANDAFGHGQNPATLLGAMLRIDVTSDPSQPYLIPGGNPWVTENWNGQAVRDEIWGLGLRNPWRYSFDRLTGDLWIADVGQNQYEEVHWVGADRLAQGGLNFGWPIMEGLNCFQAATCNQDGLELPVIEYDHSQGCSITGGHVYRGSQFPGLYGAYIYGDYCSGRIWAHWPDAPNGPVTRAMLDSRMTLTSFGEDEQGELYLTDFGSGAVYQVVEP
jgi:glucose/arabinose dehydrogenase